MASANLAAVGESEVFKGSATSGLFHLVLQIVIIVYLDGERGRNRTYNLLIAGKLPRINGFNDFQTCTLGKNRQF